MSKLQNIFPPYLFFMFLEDDREDEGERKRKGVCFLSTKRMRVG
jgi:hypothetical protein